jgi:hypothetical protein
MASMPSRPYSGRGSARGERAWRTTHSFNSPLGLNIEIIMNFNERFLYKIVAFPAKIRQKQIKNQQRKDYSNVDKN